MCLQPHPDTHNQATTTAGKYWAECTDSTVFKQHFSLFLSSYYDLWHNSLAGRGRQVRQVELVFPPPGLITYQLCIQSEW